MLWCNTFTQCLTYEKFNFIWDIWQSIFPYLKTLIMIQSVMLIGKTFLKLWYAENVVKIVTATTCKNVTQYQFEHLITVQSLSIYLTRSPKHSNIYKILQIRPSCFQVWLKLNIVHFEQTTQLFAQWRSLTLPRGARFGPMLRGDLLFMVYSCSWWQHSATSLHKTRRSTIGSTLSALSQRHAHL